MRRPFRLALLLMLCPCVGAPVAAQEVERAQAIAREVERLATARTFWPGFDPLTIPLAVFTGRQTWLFRHPSPPEGFRPFTDAPRVFVLDGRHPAVTSNSSAAIGGVMTATVLADGARTNQNASALAATALHEAFHVFQRARHPLFNGIRRVIVAGVSKPVTRTEGTGLELRTAGFTAQFANATMAVKGTTMTIQVAPRR